MGTAVATLGQRLTLTIDGLGHEGQGVGRWGEMVVFVPEALPGETVQVRVRRRARRHLEAELLGVEQPSPDRQRPACILASRCGGCTLLHCLDQRQAELKTDLVRQALQRLGQLSVPVQPIWRAASGLGYRNRALIPWSAQLKARCGPGITGGVAIASSTSTAVRCWIHASMI